VELVFEPHYLQEDIVNGKCDAWRVQQETVGDKRK